MSNYVQKARRIYKNQGSKALIKKAVKFGTHKIASVMPPADRKQYPELWKEYEFVATKIFQITSEDIIKSKDTIRHSELGEIKTANWFIPNFDHLKFGGIFTIFRFIEKFSIEGVENRIIIYDHPSFDVHKLKTEIGQNFPHLKNYKIFIFDHANDEINDLPACDVAFCTFWISAYVLLKFNKTKRKYYFIQDYEPLFYAGGSTFALAESTYRFGFRGLVNTPGLLAAVNQRHGMEGISFIPAVDRTIYYPDPHKHNERVKIFFYARPMNPRNAFNLGIVIIRQLLEKYGDKIEVVTAGSEWNEGAFGLHQKITNLGLLKSLDEVGRLYRSCDIGFCYMLSKHPSYQPFEFMASGMATVTNNNEDNLWMLKDGTNCLLSEPSPAAMVEKISMLIDDKQLRDKISQSGLDSLGYTWDQQTEMIWNDIKNK